MKAVLCLIAATAAAETVTLAPSQDGDIYSYLDQPTSTVYTLNVSASGEGAPHSNRSLIQFDLGVLGIPAAEIGSAVLRLYVYPPDMGTAGFGNVSLRRQASAWTPATLRWNRIQPQEQVTLLPVTSMNAWVEADMTSVVKQWVAGTVPNHGLVMMPESETSALNVTFLSMDMPTATYRPHLVVTRTEVTPALDILSSGGQIVLEWPAAASGWTLQEAHDLAGPWTNSALAPATVNGKWQVVRAPGGSGRGFFRLVKP
jgi:hypothetical protein